MSVFRKKDTLIVFGYMSKALVYHAITRLDVLSEAKRSGFTRVEFAQKGSGGNYVYDLTGSTLPRCDVSERLCI